jgi:NTE family protein
VLDEAGVLVHVLTGTSMGSLIGGLYAMGFTDSMLVEAATLQDWDGLFRDAPEPEVQPPDRALPGQESILLNLDLREAELELPVAYLAGQRIFQVFARLTWPVAAVSDFRRLPRPFAAVATDLETGDAIVLDHGSLAQAMRASMSLPGMFAPIEIEGRLLADGGLVRNLPAEDALALGTGRSQAAFRSGDRAEYGWPGAQATWRHR